MQKQVIIGFRPEDKRYKNKIQKWGDQGKLGDKIRVVPLNDDRFYFDDGALDREGLSWALKDAALVIVLVGENPDDHPWLEWEGEFCHQWGIKRRLVRIPYTEAWLPEEFRVLTEIAYNPNAIEKELRETTNHSHY